MESTRAEQVTDVCTHHGEGPCWDAAAGVLRFVDLSRGGLMTLDPTSGEVSRRTLGAVVACVRPRRDGGLVVALERQVALLPAGFAEDDASLENGAVETAVRILPPFWDDASVRFNDGGCDAAGRFWMGSMAYDEAQGRGSVRRIDPDGDATVVLDGVTISNGLHFAADGTWAYYIDTPTGRVDVLEVDPGPGTVVGRRPFVTIPSEVGHPDGMTVDAEGGVWVALWGGSAVHRYGPDGSLDAVVELPASQVSCPAFGGPDLADLYITTSRQGLPDDAEPAAGALFRVTPGVRGVPTLPYAG